LTGVNLLIRRAPFAASTNRKKMLQPLTSIKAGDAPARHG
jgi:hypothetical protein